MSPLETASMAWRDWLTAIQNSRAVSPEITRMGIDRKKKKSLAHGGRSGKSAEVPEINWLE